jgi:hypothetical protein
MIDWHKSASFAKEHVLIPSLIFIIGIVVADQVKEWWLGPKAYKIYFVGNLQDKDVKRVLLGVKQESDSDKLEVDGVNVEFEREDDNGTAEGARAVAAKLAKQDDTLIVIGHVLDQQTAEALPIYMSASPAVPVIATVETYPRLAQDIPKCTHEKSENDYCPFIQMSPSEDEEAVRAVDFAIKKGKKRFLVASETGGIGNDKTTALRKDYQKILTEPGNGASGIESAVFIDIPNQSVPDIAKIQLADPDCILYIGGLDTALPLIHSVQRVTNQNHWPLFVLSETSLRRSFLPENFPDLTDVYVVSQEDGREIKMPSSVYGRDAYNIASTLLQAANAQLTTSPTWLYKLRKAINMHRAADVRQAIKNTMVHGELSAQDFTGSSQNVYRFSNHKRVNSHFHMLQMSKAGLTDADCLTLPCYN